VLQQFLDAKPLYYDTIDYTRMPRAYDSIKEKLTTPKIIHLIGTNGKGTTGRFLASALHAQNFSVGHYTSPHIINFNERIWLNASLVTEQTLQKAHTQLLELLPPQMAKELSYFEYTTLLAMVIFQKCDYVVLEAGLGGEYDATAVFDTQLTLITPIDKDHETFLGSSIKEIATTKLKAIKKHAIIAKQHHLEVYDVLQSLSQTQHISYTQVEQLLHKQDILNAQQIASSLKLPNYLQENLKHAIAALRFLGISYTQQSFKDAHLFGRLTKFKKNILLDVGHNPLAAKAIYEALAPHKYILIYNTYKDKEYEKILKILHPIIKHIEYIQVKDARIESQDKLFQAFEKLGIKAHDFQHIDPQEEYLVFGSFSVVETFLKEFHG
jgi:dihydrofolate synthase/folylpolyglutamate synthase